MLKNEQSMATQFGYKIFNGLRILEIEGKPGVGYISKVLIEFGADITLIRTNNSNYPDFLNEGKRIIYLSTTSNVKLNDIISNSDVIFNMENNELGITIPEIMIINPFLIIMNFDESQSNFNSVLIPFLHLSQAVTHIRNGNIGIIIRSRVSIDFLNKSSNNELFTFTMVSKNYQFLLLEFEKNKYIYDNMKKICERLFIEVLNYAKLEIHDRIELIREYTENFGIITGSLESCIKKLSRYLHGTDILKCLCKFNKKYVYISQICQYKDIVEFIENNGNWRVYNYYDVNLLCNGEYRINFKPKF